ncbi:SseB family protein [Streptomyces sp. HNM0575]|uniref:SseB family protein n=1 Tax=Streptomyces sp. HNM0575 TaxID=2716338 RepID=UPI00145D3507|nr:SseB family protein [Streptomyces sp. HNM0575]NLU71842.1 SseB family protein [Streptomyces sp. HNM0575]
MRPHREAAGGGDRDGAGDDGDAPGDGDGRDGEGAGAGAGEGGPDRSAPEDTRYSAKASGLAHAQLLRYPDGSPVPGDGPGIGTGNGPDVGHGIGRDVGHRVGHEPERIPVTGHNVYVDLAASGTAELVMEGLRAEVLARRPLEPGTVGPAPGPASAPDRCEPVVTPDVEVFLDEDPPLVRRALDGDGAPAWPEFGLPLRLGPGRETRVVLAPHTGDRGLVDWRLIADVTCGGRRSSPQWDFQVTAETGRRSFRTDGGEEPAPAHDATAHWKPAWPPGSSPRPGGDGPYGGETYGRDPHEARYLRSRREGDFVRSVRELLGMRVWLPLGGHGRDFTVAHRDGERLVRAYTSADRAGRLPRPPDEPATVQVRRFADLVRLWRHPEIGLVINPDGESELRIPRSLFHRVIRIQDGGTG